MVVENTSFINNTSVQNGGAVALKQVYNLKRDQKILSILFKNT
jgi:predicted outer membrane repeat protein